MNLMTHLNVNNTNENTANLDSIEQKLEQNEKIMQIYSESLPHSHQRNNQTTSLTGTSDNNLTENQVYNAVISIFLWINIYDHFCHMLAYLFIF